jgi:uncharacterized protein (DUF58 family)
MPSALAHAPAGARFIDPRVLSRIGNLELLARTVVEGFLSGLHRSPHLGLSTDFAEHRPYLPGDDLRRLDWKLWARTDRLYLKEFEADTNAAVCVLLDCSPSMRYASAGVSKLDYARYLAASLLWFSRNQRDRVGLVTFDGEVTGYVPPSTRHLPNALYALEAVEAVERKSGRSGGAAEARSLERPMRQSAEHLRRRGILVVVSDFYEPPAQVLRALGHLRRRGSDLIAFHVLDPAELAFPFAEATNFEDAESGVRIPVVPDRLRDQYRERVAAHSAELRRMLTRNGIDYTLLDTSKPLDHALFTYLSNRQRLARVR